MIVDLLANFLVSPSNRPTFSTNGHFSSIHKNEIINFHFGKKKGNIILSGLAFIIYYICTGNI